MIEIEIDGKTLSVSEGSTIIEVADNAGIYIPRFCYHKKLSIAANCRMCLVEVEKVGKPLPACATPVSAGMKVFTRSQKALQAQRAVMEFLLINHPLDCPICDQGGECELQDLSLGFGHADSNYNEPKRSVKSDDIGPLIETWMTRCIHCTRCVRFGEEIAGLRELGVTGRGELSQIGTYVKHFLHSELSGNIIDICPVGALTNKPARYTGRGWEYREHPTIAPHDCVGSNIFVHSRGRQLIPQRHVMRAVPRECEHINETWISDRDRYSVHGLYDSSRVYKPRIKQNGVWVEVEWQRVLDEIIDKVHGIISQHGAEQIGALASPNASVEELYLLQKFMRALGSNNIDHRMRENDFSDQESFYVSNPLGLKISDIEDLDIIVLIGSNIRFEQPMLNHRINKAVGEGASVIAINSMDYEFNYPVQHQLIVSPTELTQALASVARALSEITGDSLAALNSVSPGETCRAIATKLHEGQKVAFFLGEHAMAHHEAAQIRKLTRYIARLAKGSVGILTAGANATGAWLAGCVPHKTAALESVSAPGLNAKEMLTDHSRKAYILLNTEPELDSAYAFEAQRNLELAPLVICLSPFANESMLAYADFILPIAPFTETPGTFVNIEGEWQSFSAVTPPHEDAKPAWKVLRVLANFAELEGFQYTTIHEVNAEIKHKVDHLAQVEAQVEAPTASFTSSPELMRLGSWPIYVTDNLVRRSAPLQEAPVCEDMQLSVNKNTASQLGLAKGERVVAIQNDSKVALVLSINDSLADNTVLLPSGFKKVSGFGQAFAPIKIERG